MSAITSYVPISEISTFNGNVTLTDYILISRSATAGQDGYTSYKAGVESFADALSGAMKEPIKEYVMSSLKTLASCDPADIEYSDGTYKLTSYAPKVCACTACDISDYTISAKGNCVISALRWDNNRSIYELGQFDMDAFRKSIMSDDLVKELSNRSINNGVQVVPEASGGVKLAQIVTDSISTEISSGDPRDIVSIESKTDVGAEIAHVTYCDGSEVIIKDNLDVKQVNASFSNSYCGDDIATINGTTLKNNLSVKSLTDLGEHVAAINGTYVNSGIEAEAIAGTGDEIAKITSPAGLVTLKNGIVISGIKTCSTAKEVCKINNQQIWNNVDVTDQCAANGAKIATVNGVDLYNDVKVEHNEGKHQTYINEHEVWGGIKLGSITPLTQTGNKIATAETASGKVALFSGIDEAVLRASILATAQGYVNALRSYVDEQLKKYVLKSEANAALYADSGKVITGIVQTDGKIVRITQDSVKQQVVNNTYTTVQKVYTTTSHTVNKSGVSSAATGQYTEYIYTSIGNSALHVKIWLANRCGVSNSKPRACYKQAGVSTTLVCSFSSLSKGASAEGDVTLVAGEKLFVKGNHTGSHATHWSITGTDTY